MRNKAPVMFCFGLCMVLMQYLATFAVIAGMIMPTCIDSDQCESGQFCYTNPGAVSGRCLYCGENPPLVRY